MKYGPLVPNELKYDGYERLDSYIVTGSPITSFSFTGLDGYGDEEYILEGNCVSALACLFRLRVNNQSGAAEYLAQTLSGENAVITAAQGTSDNIALFQADNADESGLFKIVINAETLTFNPMLMSRIDAVNGTTVKRVWSRGQVWTHSYNSSFNIISLDIFSSIALGIKEGSKFTLWRKIKKV